MEMEVEMNKQVFGLIEKFFKHYYVHLQNIQRVTLQSYWPSLEWFLLKPLSTATATLAFEQIPQPTLTMPLLGEVAHFCKIISPSSFMP